ncbi:MAG TPA: DNA translocase FtsK, partial [Dehalococcoidia bacterium]|nr:DNA translocase FtsK [Dehalococcoidia bacterium]
SQARRGAAKAAGPRFGEAFLELLRPDFIGLALILIATLAVTWLAPLDSAAPKLRDDLVETLGLGVFIAIALALAAGWALYRRMLPGSWPARRRWLGIAASALFAIGALSLYEPDLTIGAISLSDESAGGRVGRSLTDGPLAILAWLGIGFAAVTLLWPRSVWQLLRRSPQLGRFIVSLRIPQRAWLAAQALWRWLKWLYRSSSDEDTDPLDRIGARNPFDERYEAEPFFLDAEAEHSAFSPGGALATRYSAATTASVGVEATPALESAMPPHAVPLGRTLPLPGFTLPERPAVREVPSSGPGPAPASVIDRAPTATPARWRAAPLDLLKPASERDGQALDNQRRAELIVQTLASFGVDARVVGIQEGPTVTQFGVEPGWEVKTRTVQERDKDGKPVLDKDGRPKMRTEEVSRTRVRVSQITSLANDLALALAAPSIRIEAPVPGRPVVGIEVPNHDATVVNLRSVLATPAFQRVSARSKLALALGQGVSGEPIVTDLAKMPHLLIAGATGSGKSVCINAIIASLLMRSSPDEVRFVMIDPKRVELAPFAQIPHLAFSRVIVDIDEVPGALQAVISEMEARYRKFAALAVRNLDAYNKHPKVVDRLPYWVVVIDELADLMMSAAYEVERQICRLAQLARATGIHLIVATQRPSVDVVTGLIKANFPSRIAFAVSSQVDSRTILDMSGAEKLLGRGDMLFLPNDAGQPKRVQGAYVSDQEIETLVEYWRSQAADARIERYDHLLEEARRLHEEEEIEEARDALFERARDLALEHTRISTSMLQRRLRIGYPRAARIMDELEAEGIVGPAEGGGSREVLVSPGEVDDETDWATIDPA